MRRVGAVLVLVALLALSVACGDGNAPQPVETARSTQGFAVRSEVVSHETTQDILVFAPDAEGSWPVVLALHGIGGDAYDMAAIATRLAGEGFVVFAPNYRSDLSSREGFLQAVRDGECGYRFARSIATEHGGDLDQPVTFVGWSLGATFALALGLTEQIDQSGEIVSCFTEVPRADVVVAISGCHYEWAGTKTGFDISGFGNRDAEVVLLAGENDTTCPSWQSNDAASALRAAGFDVDLVVLDGASHYAPVFRDRTGGTLRVVPDDPAGERTVATILAAVAASRDRG